jgi:hypothetical protein
MIASPASAARSAPNAVSPCKRPVAMMLTGFATQNIKAQRNISYIVTSEIAETDVRKGTTSYTALLHKPLHIDDMIQMFWIVLDIFQLHCSPSHPFEQSHVVFVSWRPLPTCMRASNLVFAQPGWVVACPRKVCWIAW